MKFQRILCSLGLVVCSCSMAQAELVTFTLTLDAPSAAANRLTLSLLGGSAPTDLIGSFQAQAEFNRATGVVSSLELLYTGVPTLTTTNWSLTTTMANGTIPIAGVTLSGTGITAAMDTTVPASVVTAGSFPSAEQEVRLIGGMVAAPLIGFSDTFTPADSVDIPGVTGGTGTITSTLNAGLGVYDIVFSLPIADSQEIATNTDLLITGNVLARGQIAVVPEPSSALLLLVSGCGIVFGRRRLA